MSKGIKWHQKIWWCGDNWSCITIIIVPLEVILTRASSGIQSMMAQHIIGEYCNPIHFREFRECLKFAKLNGRENALYIFFQTNIVLKVFFSIYIFMWVPFCIFL